MDNAMVEREWRRSDSKIKKTRLGAARSKIRASTLSYLQLCRYLES